MAAYFNRVILAGNLTRDPQLSYTSANTPVCKFGLAINRRYKVRDTGENREEVCFVDCTAFGRTGETINQYLKKGRPILLEGRLQYSQWEGQDGAKRSKLEVVVENFTFLSDGSGGGSGGGPRMAQPSREGAPSAAASAAAPPPMHDDYDIPAGDENVPF